MTPNNKKEIFGWCMYDWANSAFATTIMAGFFPVFFKLYWSEGTEVTTSTAMLGMANSIAGCVVALSAPVLGAIADSGTLKKRFLMLFAFVGVVMTSGLYLVSKGNWPWAVLFYVIATVGFSGGNALYDGLITHVASDEQLDRVSALGFSLGYLGGGILFALNVWMTLKPEIFGFADSGQAVRFSFLSVGVWWAVFSIPIFLFVKESGMRERISGWNAVKAGFSQLQGTFREVRSHKNVFVFLVAYWLYIDGVDTIIRMAVDYGISIGFESKDLIVALLITQFIGFPSTFGFIYYGKKVGTKGAIFTAIAVYLFVTLWGGFMQSKGEFFVLAIIIGLVQGGIQAFSRSSYARIIPVMKSAEYFGFYNMIGKFSVIIGPVLMGGVGLLFRSMGYSAGIASRASIMSISILFLAGGTLFYFVKDERVGENSHKE